MTENEKTFYIGITLVILGIIGIGSIVESQCFGKNIVTVDRFVIGIGLILWRISKIKTDD